MSITVAQYIRNELAKALGSEAIVSDEEIGRSLKEIEIPENVEYIDDEAFLGCTGLRRGILRTKHIRDDHWLPDELKAKVRIEYAI